MIGITSYGGYIPRLRLSRMKIVEHMAWYFPVIMAVAGGEKAVAHWDEDALTMAVAAAYDCLSGRERNALDGIYLASTTLPFADMLNSSILATAVNAGEKGLDCADMTGSLRAGTIAMCRALDAVASGTKENVLVVASDQRRTKMATMYEMFLGDGAAALQFGKEHVIARYLGGYSYTSCFADHYRGWDKAFDYAWEERWVRDEGFAKIIPEAISEFCDTMHMSPGDFDRIVYPCYFSGTHRSIAKSLGVDYGRVQDNLHSLTGDTGTAHPLIMCAAALEAAQPGDRLLVAGFGQGCDVLAFEVTEEFAGFERSRGIARSLARKAELTNYLKYAKFRDLIMADLGIRGEANPNTSLTDLWRKRKMITGLVGAKCRVCGTPQYATTSVCVNPECNAVDNFEEYRFADKEGKVLMYTGDLLAPSVDPPAVYGMVEFNGGGRIFLDFTDCTLEELSVGMPVSLSFRIKSRDRMRGFTRYFWKAVSQVQEGKGV